VAVWQHAPVSERRFEVVLFGATGFTGGLVAEELARAGELRWAIAGRDQGKLAQVRGQLASIDPRLSELPLIIADSHDAGALDALAKQTRVVCTTVGPYARHGSELVAACAANGTHYCDLTGEPQWIRRMIDAYHERAKASGATRSASRRSGRRFVCWTGSARPVSVPWER